MVAGFSGGADSLALVLLLEEISGSGQLPLELSLAHLEHGLRGAESRQDERFCRRFAREHGLPICVEEVDAAAVAEAEGGNLEAVARRLRYDFLRRAAEQAGACAVATGHQADDVAETVLLRLLRGAAVTGLGAMRPVRPLGASVRLVRPLLSARRHELRSYLESKGETWRRDSSNRDVRYTRNRIRHELIPALEADYPTFSVESLAALNESALEVTELLSELSDRLWRDACRRDAGGEVVLEAGPLAEAPAALRKVAGARAVGRLEAEAPLRAEHYAELAALPRRPVGEELTLPGGVLARREHGAVYFARRKPAERLPQRRLDIPGQVEVPEAGLRIECAELPGELDPEQARAMSSRWQVHVARRPVGDHLLVRGRRPGDRFHPLGGPGRRKLKEFLIDARVPRHERDRIPLVLADGRRIVWVVGHRMGEPFRIPRGGARALRLRAVRATGVET